MISWNKKISFYLAILIIFLASLICTLLVWQSAGGNDLKIDKQAAARQE